MRHLFFLKDPSLLATASLLADATTDGAAAGNGGPPPEWVNVLPEPDKDGNIYSRDNRVLHIDSMEKLAKRSNAALKKQKGGGLVDRDHETYGGFFVAGGGPAIAWAEQFEARPGKGMWARTDWLAAGEQHFSARDYRYTSAVVSGGIEAEVDEEAWSVTWHITPETVDGFAITNIPALVTTSMFSERTPEQRRDEMLAVLLKKLGVPPDAGMPEVREAFGKLTRFTATSGEGEAEADSPPRNLEKPTQPIDGEPPPPLKKDDDQGEAEGTSADEEPAPPAAVPPPTVPSPTPSPAPASAGEDPVVAALRKRIGELEVEAAKSFVDGLVHTGKVTPAMRPAVLKACSTAQGLADQRDIYKLAPQIVGAGTSTALTSTPTTEAPHGVDPLAHHLARQGASVQDIAQQLARRDQEKTR